jgi:long-chain fatty acid transport protein
MEWNAGGSTVKLILLCLLIVSSMFCIIGLARGNGFDIYEQSARAVGIAGAMTAQADDPSAIFFNPAGITQLDGTQISMGACMIMPTMQFQSSGNAVMGSYPGQTSKIKGHTWVIPNMYVTHKINDMVSVGIGSFSHFGLGVEWGDYWEGRFTPGATKSILATTSFSPVIALKPFENLSIGFGPYVQYFDIQLNNLAFITPPTPPLRPNSNRAQTVDATLTAHNWDWGWQAGFRLKIIEGLAFGAAYLSEVSHKITGGDQELTSLANGSAILKQGFSGEFTLPATLRLGLAWQSDKWAIEAGAQWTEWSSYKTLKAVFDNGTSLVSPKNWHNAWLWRIGGQYRVNPYLDLRVGFFYDETPIPSNTLDPLVPSGDRKGYCGGVGLHFHAFTFDVGYNYIQDESRTWNNTSGDVKVGPATITRVTGKFEKAYAHIFALNVTYRF